MFHCSGTSGTSTLRTNKIAGRMLCSLGTLVSSTLALLRHFSRLSGYLWGARASLGSCYLTGSLQLSSGVIFKIVSTASAHCTRPKQNTLSSVEISVGKTVFIEQESDASNSALYSLVGSARLVRSYIWTFSWDFTRYAFRSRLR